MDHGSSLARAESSPSRAELYCSALDAEVTHQDWSRASRLYAEVSSGPAGDLGTWALLGMARICLRTDDWKKFAQIVARLSQAKALTPPQDEELRRLKKLKDELAREPHRPDLQPPVNHRPTRPKVQAVPPSRAVMTRDIDLVDAGLEDAATSLGTLFGVTIVTEPVFARVTLSLKRVTLNQALMAIVFQSGLSGRLAGGVYYLGQPRRVASWLSSSQSHSIEELLSGETVAPRAAPSGPVTLALSDLSVFEATHRFIQAFSVNIVPYRSTDRVSLDLQQVSPDGALRALASRLGWETRNVGGLYFLGPGPHLAKYFPGFERRYVRLKNTDAGQIYDDLQEFLGASKLRLSRVEVDIVGNALAIEGDKLGLDKVEAFLLELDQRPQSLNLELILSEGSEPTTEESRVKRMRMRNGQAGIVTLVASSAAEKSQGVETQLEVELTPRIKGPEQVVFDVHWRYSSLKGNAIGDVKEGRARQVTTRMGVPLEIPILTKSPTDTKGVVLTVRPEP